MTQVASLAAVSDVRLKDGDAIEVARIAHQAYNRAHAVFNTYRETALTGFSPEQVDLLHNAAFFHFFDERCFDSQALDELDEIVDDKSSDNHQELVSLLHQVGTFGDDRLGLRIESGRFGFLVKWTKLDSVELSTETQ